MLKWKNSVYRKFYLQSRHRIHWCYLPSLQSLAITWLHVLNWVVWGENTAALVRAATRLQRVTAIADDAWMLLQVAFHRAIVHGQQCALSVQSSSVDIAATAAVLNLHEVLLTRLHSIVDAGTFWATLLVQVRLRHHHTVRLPKLVVAEAAIAMVARWADRVLRAHRRILLELVVAELAFIGSAWGLFCRSRLFNTTEWWRGRPSRLRRRAAHATGVR